MKKININNEDLRPSEALTLILSKIYESYGYSHFKMSKFEEYDLYAKNKEFLQSDGIITFTDHGRLLALKPDVTLSIIKNTSDLTDVCEKYYYNESVYRKIGGKSTFGELLQIGVECVGDIGAYETAETVIMAKKSLAAVSENYVIDISHMGIVAELLSEISVSEEDKRAIIKCLGEKSAHGIALICDKNEAPENIKNALISLVKLDGEIGETLSAISENIPELKDSAALSELFDLSVMLSAAGMNENIRIDFSVVCDGTYYNGIVFRGFIDGVPERVLSGGRYDFLMRRMGKKNGGIGFAVYADTLYGILRDRGGERAVDVLILDDTNGNAPKTAIIKLTEQYVECGKKVLVSKTVPTGGRFGEIIRLSEVNV